MSPVGNNAEDRVAGAARDAQQGRHAQAEIKFREILVSEPANVEAKFGLATVLATSGRLHEAIGLFREVLQARPDHLAAWANLGNALLHRGDYHEAENAFRAVLKIKPDTSPALYGLGCALQYQGRHAEAESHFRRTLQFQPNDPGLWMNLGTVLKHQRKLNDAIESYRKVTQLTPDLHQGWSAFGQTLLESGRPQEAEQAFRHAIRLAPEVVEARIGLGDAVSSQQRADTALESYLAAIALDPKSQNAHTKAESLLLRMAGATGEQSVFTRLLENRVYDRPTDSVPDALALVDAYTYPVAGVLDETKALLRQFDPEQLYPGAWWKEQLSRFGTPNEGHDKVFRGVSSAIYSWSPPCQEAVEAVAAFTGDAVLHSFGAGTGYWEWLLARHFGTRVLAGDRVLRHRFIEMVVEDYATASVNENEVVFLAWIPQGIDAVMNLLRQIRAGQKLVIVGQGPDDTGKARICATDDVFRYLETAFEPTGKIPLGYYSYIRDDVRMYRRR
jgi:tetratricopeptide (TPR) repeat protein